ncbi:MAG TPA: cyclic nucleotide-binding domain-containing protein [Candidatus Limnocylindrales bacterium]|nr:cyclic nucleotide-binding domain-containing protein [Candidatus Limnocylindrales bacterium]
MRTSPALKKLVLAHPFLANVKPSVGLHFCQCGSLQRFDVGKQLFCEGGKADSFYLINNGQVLLEAFVPGRRMITIQAVGPGEALGWSWLFPPHQWHFSATAVKPTEALVFAAKRLREKAQQDHEFCYELVIRLAGVLAGRLEDVRTRLIYAHQYTPGI